MRDLLNCVICLQRADDYTDVECATVVHRGMSLCEKCFVEEYHGPAGDYVKEIIRDYYRLEE